MKKRKKIRKRLLEERNVSEDRLDTAKRHAVRTGVALAASAALVAGGLFNSPADLIRNQNAGTLDRAFTPALEQILREENEEEKPEDSTETNGSGTGGDDAPGEQIPEHTLSDSMRDRIYRIPVALRILIGIPAWGTGWLLLSLIKLLSGMVLPSVLGKLFGWLLLSAVILAAVAFTIKAVFPDLPLKKILNKKMILTVAISILILGTADTVLSYFLQDYRHYSNVVKLTGTFVIVMGTVTTYVLRRKALIHWIPKKLNVNGICASAQNSIPNGE